MNYVKNALNVWLLFCKDFISFQFFWLLCLFPNFVLSPDSFLFVIACSCNALEKSYSNVNQGLLQWKSHLFFLSEIYLIWQKQIRCHWSFKANKPFSFDFQTLMGGKLFLNWRKQLKIKTFMLPASKRERLHWHAINLFYSRHKKT